MVDNIVTTPLQSKLFLKFKKKILGKIYYGCRCGTGYEVQKVSVRVKRLLIMMKVYTVSALMESFMGGGA